MRFIVVFVFLFSLSPVQAQDTSHVIIPLFSSDAQELAKSITAQLSSEPKLFPVTPEAELKLPDLPAEGFASADFIKLLSEIGKKKGTSHVVAGTIDMKGTPTATAVMYLISASESKILYTTTHYFNPGDKDYNPILDIAGRIKLFEDKKSFSVKNISASAGTSMQHTQVSWEPVPECNGYGVFRSKIKDGVYTPVNTTTDSSYKDTTADPGFKYYYRIAPYYNGICTDLSDSVTGFRRPPYPKDKDLKKLIESFNKPKPRLTGEAAAKAEKHVSMIKEIYFNKVKLNIMLFISRSYIEKKELYVFNGFTNFTIDKAKRKISIVSDKGDFELFFDNNTFFTRIVKLEDDELSEILVRNAVFFGVPSSWKEKPLDNGETTFIPVFEIASMCTQYFKDCKDWSESTVIFATSNKTLREKMENARKQSESVTNE